MLFFCIAFCIGFLGSGLVGQSLVVSEMTLTGVRVNFFAPSQDTTKNVTLGRQR